MQQVGPEPYKATIPSMVRQGWRGNICHGHLCSPPRDADEYALVPSVKMILDKLKLTPQSQRCHPSTLDFELTHSWKQQRISKNGFGILANKKSSFQQEAYSYTGKTQPIDTLHPPCNLYLIESNTANTSPHKEQPSTNTTAYHSSNSCPRNTCQTRVQYLQKAPKTSRTPKSCCKQEESQQQ